MEMLNNDGHLPDWCVVEAYFEGTWRFRITIRCADADTQIMDVQAHELFSPGRTSRLNTTREALLRAVHEQVTVELAKLALEKE
jgi:hypothetical protein